MASKLSWIVEVLGIDKLATLEQKLRDLDKATATGKVGISTPAAAAGGAAGGITVGGVALTAAQIAEMETAARTMGLGLPEAMKGQLTANLMKNVLNKIHPTLNFSREEVMGAQFGKTVAEAIAKPVGEKDGPLSKAFAQLFQRLGGTGLSQIPGMSALGGMWTIRPITQILAGLSGASVVAVAAGLAGFIAAITAAVLAVHEFIKAVREGANLYNRATRLGLSADKVAMLDSLASAAGMRPEQLEQLLLAGEFRKGTPITFEGMMMGARRMGDTAAMQQLLNQRNIIEWQLSQAQTRMGFSGTPAADFKEISVLSGDISANWGLIKARIADTVASVTGVKSVMQAVDISLNNIATLKTPDWIKRLGMLEKLAFLGPFAIDMGAGPNATKGGFQKFPGLGTSIHPIANRWERLGFATGPGGDPYLHAMHEIARNTKKIADHTQGTTSSALAVAAHALYTSLSAWLHHGNANLP